jgi:hypothetical protein
MGFEDKKMMKNNMGGGGGDVYMVWISKNLGKNC